MEQHAEARRTAIKIEEEEKNEMIFRCYNYGLLAMMFIFKN